MFPAMCHHVAHEVGGNTLIPSPSLDESKRLLPLNVVTMIQKRKFFIFSSIEISAHDISLTDLLIDKHLLKETKCCSYNNPEGTYTLHGNIGEDMKGRVGVSLSASDKVVTNVKFGNLLCQEIQDANFVSALSKRKLDMNHPFISKLKDTNAVLCVVKSVIKTTNNIEIRRTDNTDVNIKLSEKVISAIGVDIGGASSSVREIVIEPGTTLAYKLWKLKVCEDGEIIPIMTATHRGGVFKQNEENDELSTDDEDDEFSTDKYGFSPNNDEEDDEFSTDKYGFSPNNDEDAEALSIDEDEVAAALKDLQDRVQPLRDCTEANGQTIKSSLLELMTCYCDVVTISKILSNAENGSLNEDKDTLDKQFINNDTVWSILTFVGVQTDKGRVLYKGEATPILIAVAYMIDAILELETDDLINIYQCDKPQLKTLLTIFESAVASSMTNSIDVDMSSVRTEHVSSFLTRLKFTVCNDSIQPPKAKTCIVECIFCVLYCLS